MNSEKPSNKNVGQIQHCNCTGCAVCQVVCKVGAIKMIEEQDGFSYPMVDNQRCVKCGICYEKCHTNIPNNKWNQSIGFAGHYVLEEKLAQSSSGGAATAISEYTIKNKGGIYGVTFDSEFRRTIYSYAVNISDLDGFKTSKYVQADPPNYVEIKKKLKTGETITFIGLPCQCDALHSYLGKDYENLTIVSLVCHGPTSTLVLGEYINELKKKFGRMKDFKLRYKRNGYTRPTRIYCIDENDKVHILPFISSSFGMAFELLNRESCSHCHSKFPNGYADIILGDFWGGKNEKSKQAEKGESLIILRNPEKEYVLDGLKDLGFDVEIVDISGIEKKNPSISNSAVPNKCREKLIKDIHEVGLQQAVRNNTSKKERMVNSIYYFLRCIIPQRIWSKLR